MLETKVGLSIEKVTVLGLDGSGGASALEVNETQYVTSFSNIKLSALEHKYLEKIKGGKKKKTQECNRGG